MSTPGRKPPKKEGKVTVRLLEDRIAVIADAATTKSAGGLDIPESAQEIERYGEVAIVGTGHYADSTGVLIPIDVKVGDRVIFHRASGSPVKLDGTEYTILAAREIIGIVA